MTSGSLDETHTATVNQFLGFKRDVEGNNNPGLEDLARMLQACTRARCVGGGGWWGGAAGCCKHAHGQGACVGGGRVGGGQAAAGQL